MKKLVLGTLVGILLFSVFGCAGNKKVKKGLPDSDFKNWPEWYMGILPVEDGKIFAKATETSLKAELAESKATAEARKKIAQTIETKVQNLEKKFDEEIGLGEDAELNSFFNSTTKVITSQVLNGSRLYKNGYAREGQLFRSFVIMLMDDSFAEQFVNKVKNNQQIYQRFRASEAFNDMEADIEKFENFKEEQGY
ncbi:MAG: hypothetical protein HN952_05810 [Candidatus Cloacimonetes bacterium]|jgi:hypothetical protein|nr:hypothetical protein [Candidatus Cloacimonadota bacterium]MBT6994455.1 hypothetical protein [Candidatus Cloacimonadota bacterium]MBT7470238.1 hypothetical protein [Candidatus Cloacimonadota bacterium]